MNKSCNCWACLDQSDFFQAMTIDEAGMVVPDWAAEILQKYANKDLPKCVNHHVFTLEEERMAESMAGAL